MGRDRPNASTPTLPSESEPSQADHFGSETNRKASAMSAGLAHKTVVEPEAEDMTFKDIYDSVCVGAHTFGVVVVNLCSTQIPKVEYDKVGSTPHPTVIYPKATLFRTQRHDEAMPDSVTFQKPTACPVPIWCKKIQPLASALSPLPPMGPPASTTTPHAFCVSDATRRVIRAAQSLGLSGLFGITDILDPHFVSPVQDATGVIAGTIALIHQSRFLGDCDSDWSAERLALFFDSLEYRMQLAACLLFVYK